MTSPDQKSVAREDSRREENPPLRRGVLPWKTQPAASLPDGSPAWGGGRGAQSRNDNFDLIRLPIDRFMQETDAARSIEPDQPGPLTPAELHRLYAGTSVPRHRYLAPALSEAVNSPEIGPHPAKWLAQISEAELASVVSAWLNTNRSTEYEQLNCIGLDPHSGQLTAVLRVKQGRGYSGGPATAGSREYVAFWIDWGSGFQHEGTASVAVHDFNRLPPGGLDYSISLPADLLSRTQHSGAGAATVKARAVLSWNTPPSTTDPNAPVVWGNSLESRIPIPRGPMARAGEPVSRLAAANPPEIDWAGGDPQIIEAAIQALAGMAFGPRAGLTVAPRSACAGASQPDQTFAIGFTQMEGRGGSFTLYVRDRAQVKRGATSNFNVASAESCWQTKRWLD